MTLNEIATLNRSYRRFTGEISIERETLQSLVDLARLSASTMNLQPLQYIISCDRDKNSLIFPCLGWAGYLKDWGGPAEGERPSAYIIILADTRISKSYGIDCGIAAQSIMLGAVEKGLGGCMIATIHRNDLSAALDIDEHFEIPLILALGKPAEKVVIEPLGTDGNVKYWRDSEGTHHVPKRALSDIIIG